MLKNISINTILAGISPSEYFAVQGMFLNSIGIDPELPKKDTETRPSGLIRPTAMINIANDLTGSMMWLISNNKTADTYFYNSDGKAGLLNSSLALSYINAGAAISGGAGNGLEYYNNYYYFALNTDVGRYGAMNGTPTLVTNFWVTTLNKTALSNTTYPSINGIPIPNHAMYVHPQNNYLYFCDVDANNIGIISMINTRKVTVEGDTDSDVVPSSYNNLDFYFNWYPTCIGSVGTMLAIGLIDGSLTTVKQRNAKIALWSAQPADTSYSIVVDLPDPLVTALKEVNGVLYIFSGSASGGMRISRYLGGNSIEEIAYFDDAFPPFQGAVDNILGRIIFGSKTSKPAVSASVFAFGGKSRAMGMGIHNIANTSSAGASPIVTAVKYIAQGAVSQPVVAWKDASLKGIDKPSTTYVDGKNIFNSEIFRIGATFNIKKIRIPLAGVIGANNSFTLKIHYDDASATSETRTVNNTNDPAKRFIDWYPQTAKGKNNFYLEIIWTGTALTVISLPITIICEMEQD